MECSYEYSNNALVVLEWLDIETVIIPVCWHFQSLCVQPSPKGGEAIGNQNVIRPRPGQSRRRHLENMGRRDKRQGFVDKVCQQGLSPTYPRGVMIETSVWRQSLPRLSPSDGRKGLKTRSTTVVVQQSPPCYSLLTDSFKVYEGRSDYPISTRNPGSHSSG